MSVSTLEADKILNEMRSSGFNLQIVDQVSFVSFKNPNYQPDNGQNPFLACTLLELLAALEHNP